MGCAGICLVIAGAMLLDFQSGCIGVFVILAGLALLRDFVDK